jgi:wyosine [tRNA(Phe)-imidazoG37] synthetase (radical SAM superfamily)
MMDLQSGILYGPIQSRRFGKSLGINLLPAGQKVCNFDCVYCQYGESRLSARPVYPKLDEIRAAFAAFAAENRTLIDQITIAGNGEPTLHPQFAEAVDLLIEMRDRHFAGIPLTILSNSSTCHRPEIRQALERLDGRFMKLDAGESGLFAQVNLPAASAPWYVMVRGLQSLKNIVLQSLFFSGPLRNTDKESVDSWIRLIQRIRPREVQVYTLSREPREKDLQPASRAQLLHIAHRLMAETGIRGVALS